MPNEAPGCSNNGGGFGTLVRTLSNLKYARGVIPLFVTQLAAQLGAELAAKVSPRQAARRTRVAALLFLLAGASTVLAQAPGRRRETNANRQARIARTVHETYSHRWEFGGGGGYLRFRSGKDLQKNSEIAFWFNGTYYLNERLGLTGEIRGAYGNAKLYNSATNYGVYYNPNISEYPYLFGPTYRLYTRERYSVSAFALGGAAIGKFDSDTKGVPSTTLGMWPSSSARPAFSLGGNLDINVYPNFAFRIAPNYTGTTFGGSLQNNVGFDMGIVYRFGQQK